MLILKKATILMIGVCLLSYMSSCSGKRQGGTSDNSDGIILGFSQIGAESNWRTCNSASIKAAAEDKGIQLLFEDAEQKQEKQIKAIRSFIVYQVDVIAFVPIVADGWDNVLTEAKEAGIPVLVTDRKISTANPDLYAGYIGTTGLREGREAARFLQKKFSDLPEGSAEAPVRIVEISGTEGASCVVERGQGFREVIEPDPRFEIVSSRSGDFLRSKGYELMKQILQEVEDIDVIYSHNDGMTLGALDAMKEEGIAPGKDIIIVSIDAEQAAIDALRRGEINCVVECNPKMGPAIVELAEKLAAGEQIPRVIDVDVQVFTEWDDLSAIEPRGY